MFNLQELTGSPHNFRMCLTLYSVFMVFYKASMFSILAVSIDRFWAICYPISYHVKSAAPTRNIILACWIVALIDGLLPLFGWNSGEFDNQCDIRVVLDLNYLLYACVPLCLLATVVIVVLHILVYLTIRKQVNL